MGGQAVHEDGIVACVAHHRFVDPVGGQQIVQVLDLVIIAHRNPDVGDDGVGAFDRRPHIVGHGDFGAVGFGPIKYFARRAQLFGASQAQGEIEALGGMDPRGRHVVAVPRPGDGLAGDSSAMLLEGHYVGHQLAGMGAVGEAVDDRHAGMLGEFQQLLLVGRPQHDRIDVARQHPGGIGDALASTELA